MRRRDTDTDTEDDSNVASASCSVCLDADPEVRSTHYLALARQMDLDAIEPHLWQSLRERKGFDATVAREHIEGIMVWVREQVLPYANIPDEHTGAKLPWWEGRRQTIQAMRRATEQQAKEAEAQRMAREYGRVARHGALRPLSDTLGTVLREPGDDAGDEWMDDTEPEEHTP